jgi:DNA-binding IclR family transcriptional regulator
VSYPAYQQIGKEIGLGFARWKVYMALQPPTLNFRKPTEIKLVWLADHAHLSRQKAREALDWLVEKRYVIEEGRDNRGVRSLTLAWDLANAA